MLIIQAILCHQIGVCAIDIEVHVFTDLRLSTGSVEYLYFLHRSVWLVCGNTRRNSEPVSHPFILSPHCICPLLEVGCNHRIDITTILRHFPSLFGISRIQYQGITVITNLPIVREMCTCFSGSHIKFSCNGCISDLIIVIYTVLHSICRSCTGTGRRVIFTRPLPANYCTHTITFKTKSNRFCDQRIIKSVGNRPIVPFLQRIMFQIFIHDLDMIVGCHCRCLAVFQCDSCGVHF